MKPIAAEWVSKAEGDFAILERECRARKDPSYDGACFHAQQCAEKYLKARLCEADISFSKIHDLVALLEQVLEVEPDWETFRENLAFLSDFAVTFRYPGESADRESALDARRRCRLKMCFVERSPCTMTMPSGSSPRVCANAKNAAVAGGAPSRRRMRAR